MVWAVYPFHGQNVDVPPRKILAPDVDVDTTCALDSKSNMGVYMHKRNFIIISASFSLLAFTSSANSEYWTFGFPGGTHRFSDGCTAAYFSAKDVLGVFGQSKVSCPVS